ncbi:MAG: hypothetical protein HPY59_11340 [Anaerolineae bacterium]|nr:hypothetical protein [Anaerolineae bacterium]
MENQTASMVVTGEKSAAVMAYTHNKLCWGEIVIKEQVRVSTWLRTNLAPEVIRIYNAKMLITTAPVESLKPMTFSEIHVPTEKVIAFHLIPPAKDPLDYDPSEPNRQMTPISVLVGAFKVDGFMRMSMQSNLAKYLEITRENFTAIYDAEISSPILSALGIFRVPYLLVRQNAVIFTTRSQ